LLKTDAIEDGCQRQLGGEVSTCFYTQIVFGSLVFGLLLTSPTSQRNYCIMELMITGETVEKVPKQTLRGDAEKNDFTECATIDDLTMMRVVRPPQNHALTVLKGFSTVSAAIEPPKSREVLLASRLH